MISNRGEGENRQQRRGQKSILSLYWMGNDCLRRPTDRSDNLRLFPSSLNECDGNLLHDSHRKRKEEEREMKLMKSR